MKSIIFAAMMMALAGCAGSGAIKWDQARQIKQGMTEQQLTDLMGKPYSVVAKPDGTQVWVWVHVGVLGGGHSSLAVPMRGGKAIADANIPSSF